jgi:hypothetical protein
MSPLQSKYAGSEAVNPFGQAENRLPFPALRLSWHNGYPQAEKTTGAKYFGGWFADAGNFIADCSEIGDIPSLSGFVGPQEWTNQDGTKTYSVYASRAIMAAPINTIVKWFKADDGKQSSTTYMLVFLAYIDKQNNKNVLLPWGPALLGGSGFKGVYMQKAFQEYARLSTQSRLINAPGVPVNQFYYRIGTFGETRITQEVGKVKKNFVVPAQVDPSLDWSEKMLINYFVDDATYGKMIDLRTKSADWFTHKDGKKDEQIQSSTNTVPPEPEFNDDFPPLE